MKIKKDFDLTKLNSFGIKAKTKYFIEINSEKDLIEVFNSAEFKNNDKLFLGGGSNLLFTKDFNGIILWNNLKGIEILEEDKENVWLRTQGGEGWNDLVKFSVEKNLWGIENLSAIPGTVGASPVQNIGAYGVELKDVLEKVEAYQIENGQKKIFENNECNFGYRDSIFKNEAKGKYFISAIILKLSKKQKLNIDYQAVKEYLEKNKIVLESSKEVSQVITEIRNSKLPDPKVLGNAGSFFKNVFVDNKKLEELLEKYPEMPYFVEGNLINPIRSRPREASATVTLGRPASNGVKIPTAWLIEETGWKGKRLGRVGVHEKQALVLVNYGGATGEEMIILAEKIMASVKQKFDIQLVPEINLI